MGGTSPGMGGGTAPTTGPSGTVGGQPVGIDAFRSVTPGMDPAAKAIEQGFERLAPQFDMTRSQYTGQTPNANPVNRPGGVYGQPIQAPAANAYMGDPAMLQNMMGMFQNFGGFSMPYANPFMFNPFMMGFGGLPGYGDPRYGQPPVDPYNKSNMGVQSSGSVATDFGVRPPQPKATDYRTFPVDKGI